MRPFRSLLLLLLLAISSVARPGLAREGDKAASPVTEANRQLVLVRSPTWWSATAVLQRYERSSSGAWAAAGASTPVNLGRGGMGWGRGLHTQLKNGPVKAEGDGRSPAGAFALSRAFGVAEQLPQGARDFPYLHSSASTYCVEDARSRYYNQIIDANDVRRSAWEKWSELRRADGLFDWGVIVQQNDPEPRKGAGSCVFLHVWRGPRIPTSGCTAMPREQIEAVVRWLDPHAEPLLVQLPEPVLQEVRESWHLP
ncbi:MAG TPA: L,D-transpeptidase family protein [Polyangiaceae bacterium]|nr:L,D-transpeptidase family protein [Polyangiaceae bacterium]